MQGGRYRSVEHYAFEKLLNALKIDEKIIEKIQTTVLPIHVGLVACRVLKMLQIDKELILEKTSKMDRWRQSAMKHKIVHNEYLQQLLLSTGDALLIDCAEGDRMWTCRSTEVELQRLLTKPYVSPEKIVEWMSAETEKIPKPLKHLQGNKTGLLLMELRGKLATATQSRIPLISPINTSAMTSIITHNVICFTAESVWHPLYPAEIRPAPDQPLMPSPAHFVAQQAVRYLGMNKEDTDYILSTNSSLECWYRLHEMIESKGRGLEREQSWWMEKRQKAIKDSLQLLLEQHPPLLRALIDTGDSMLVYCSRFSSIEAELSIGMRENDLRSWMWAVEVSSKQLLELCSRPMAFRPAFLGGNRLGLILMELRREFLLRGVFPQSLPELPLSNEAVLGTDSPTENMVVTEPFDVLLPDNYTATWINPLFLLAKSSNNPELISMCTKVKLAPRLVTVDDEKITDIVQSLVYEGKVDEELLNEVALEDLRAVFVKYCTRLRLRKEELEAQHANMQMLASEVHRLQSIRRGLEETQRRENGTSHNSIGPTTSRIAAGRDNERFDYNDLQENFDAPPLRPKPRERGEYKIPNRKRAASPIRDDKKKDRKEPTKPPAPLRVRSPPKKREPSPPKIIEEKKPPKAKRPPVEELSDGEILSTDEEDEN
ncbi:unnamed protein product [Caenorhabditis auriculariae]|uniref:NADAR domain-containing protein n=1 Tax=Caenorhabditis auriculariae TaxID=2777116 RepID=A0A8S1GZ86_9PELO|nr:unnamed protein product [Caenorhabditis auriculariae]